MEWPLGVKPLDLEKWTNAHDNFTQHLQPGASFDLSISDPEFRRQYSTFMERYNKTTENIQWLIRFAIDYNLRLRPVGSGWSLSKVAVTEGGLINTKKLRLRAKLSRSMVAPEYLEHGGDPDNLLFAQCGNTIISINTLLEKRRRPAKSLRASGGSNGQTIVGALSTGTHGAAHKFGGIAEFITGMHIVTGPDRHVWLERASYPVTTPAFRELLGAETIRDDALFNSALVSFGSFGFIHSVLVEVEPIFLLEEEFRPVAYDEGLERAICYGDFSGVADHLRYDLDTINEKLYHLEMAINPHRFERDDLEKGVYLRVLYKQPYRQDYLHIPPQDQGYTYGDDTLGLIQLVLDTVEMAPGNFLDRLIIPQTVNSLFDLAFSRPEINFGTVGQIFRNTRFRGKLFSAAYAFDRKDIPRVIDLILELNQDIPFAGVMAMRFLKGTQATLGFTHFPQTCVLELDGANVVVNQRFVETLTPRLEQANIPYTIHWGKINKVLNRERVRHIYGDERVDQWLRNRRRLMEPETMEVFNNEFLRRCGLDEVVSVIDVTV